MVATSPSAPAEAAPPLAAPFDVVRAVGCAVISLIVGVTQGLGVNLIASNLPQVQGALGATQTDTAWLLSAYYAVNVSSALLLVKFRQQYGLRLFADIGIGVFLAVTVAHLFTNDLRSAVAVRAAQGLAAAPLSTLALFYMLEAFPQSWRATALALGVGSSQLAVPLARVISPDLLEIGQWHGLYLPEVGLALLSLAGVNAIRLTPQPQVQAFDRLDILSFGLFAPALGLFCIVLGQGRYVWWTEAPWLGVCLAVGIALFVVSITIELNRSHPLINFRWITSEEMIRVAIAIVLFRVVLSEQSIGAIGFLQTLGLNNDQLAGLSWAILAATVAGFAAAAVSMSPKLMRPELVRFPALAAVLMIALGAWIDAHATSLTRPAQMYASQSLMAFASALFLPSAMMVGISRASQRGPAYIVSFIAVFSGGQSLGGLMGSSLLGSFVTVREKFHSNQLVERITLADPQVASRLRQLSGAYARVLGDKTLLNAEGPALLGQQATREAYVLAYNDLFLLIMVMALMIFAWLAVVELRERLRNRHARSEEALA